MLLVSGRSGVIHDLGMVFAHQVKGRMVGLERCEWLRSHPIPLLSSMRGPEGLSVAAPWSIGMRSATVWRRCSLFNRLLPAAVFGGALRLGVLCC